MNSKSSTSDSPFTNNQGPSSSTGSSEILPIDPCTVKYSLSDSRNLPTSAKITNPTIESIEGKPQKTVKKKKETINSSDLQQQLDFSISLIHRLEKKLDDLEQINNMLRLKSYGPDLTCEGLQRQTSIPTYSSQNKALSDRINQLETEILRSRVANLESLHQLSAQMNYVSLSQMNVLKQQVPCYYVPVGPQPMYNTHFWRPATPQMRFPQPPPYPHYGIPSRPVPQPSTGQQDNPPFNVAGKAMVSECPASEQLSRQNFQSDSVSSPETKNAFQELRPQTKLNPKLTPPRSTFRTRWSLK